MSRVFNSSKNNFNSKYVISLSAPRFFKKITSFQFRPSAQKVLTHFIEIQKSINQIKGSITKKDLTSFLEILSQMISVKHNHNLVEIEDVQSAITFYFHLSHCDQMLTLLKGDFSVLLNISTEDRVISKEFEISIPALQQLELVKEKFNIMLEKNSNGLLERLNSCILLVSSLYAKKYKIARKDMDNSYNLLRILLFRTPILEFDTIYDYFKLLNSDIFKKMNLIKITEEAQKTLKESRHYLADQKNSNALSFPNDNLIKLGVSKFPILSLLRNIAQIYGLKQNIFTIETEQIKKVIEIYEFLLNKFQFFNSYQNMTPDQLFEIYATKFSLDFPSETQDFIFKLRRTLTISMNQLVGRTEMLFNFSPLTSQIFTSIMVLSVLCANRFNHDAVLLEDIKYAIRVYTYLLLDSDLKNKIL